MKEEQIKQKAEAEADKVIIGSGMDRASVIHLKHLLVTMYMQGAAEATNELEAQIEKMNELINRYYEVCVQIPKEYRTMVFDSCLEDTRQLRR